MVTSTNLNISDDGSHFSYKATPVKHFVPTSTGNIQGNQESTFPLQNVR
jgi:hypothetical protein